MKEFTMDFYNSLLDIIQEVSTHVYHHNLWEFLNSQDRFSREFRIGGKFGFGFKLYKQGNKFYFGQYREDETLKSVEWIKRQNEFLNQFPVDTLF